MFGARLTRSSSGSALDAIARGLANGMSRREALQKGGAAFLGAVAMTPADAYAAATGHCPHNRVKCNGTCCPPGEVCLPPKKKHGNRRCGCPAHTSLCRGKCSNLQSDVRNCGHCGHKCAPSQVCVHGKCTCAPGQAVCAGACVTLAHDPKNCGKCGHKCGSGQVCSSGNCAAGCPSGHTNCHGSCADLASDAQHCGSCGAVCAAGQVCSNGQCVVNFPAGTTNCNGTCVDVGSDTSNCGACGHACGGDLVCASGVCRSK